MTCPFPQNLYEIIHASTVQYIVHLFNTADYRLERLRFSALPVDGSAIEGQKLTTLLLTH